MRARLSFCREPVITRYTSPVTLPTETILLSYREWSLNVGDERRLRGRAAPGHNRVRWSWRLLLCSFQKWLTVQNKNSIEFTNTCFSFWYHVVYIRKLTCSCLFIAFRPNNVNLTFIVYVKHMWPWTTKAVIIVFFKQNYTSSEAE